MAEAMRWTVTTHSLPCLHPLLVPYNSSQLHSKAVSHLSRQPVQHSEKGTQHPSESDKAIFFFFIHSAETYSRGLCNQNGSNMFLLYAQTMDKEGNIKGTKHMGKYQRD